MTNILFSSDYSMDISTYIEHPENLNQDSLQKLRNCVAKYPYYSAARLLLLKNLYLLNDKDFDEELKKSALYIPDRGVLHRFINQNSAEASVTSNDHRENTIVPSSLHQDRTEALIDNFLEDNTHSSEVVKQSIKADASSDYTGFLLDMDDIPAKEEATSTSRHEELMESFIDNTGKIELKEEPEYAPDSTATENENPDLSEDYFTETLARIYIKQKRYEKALEIIRKLYLAYPKKNSYFADQIRFLEKLVIINKNNKK